MLFSRKIICSLTFVTIALACHAQAGLATRSQGKPSQQDTSTAKAPHAAEDISGMYSFLKEGEFLQITLEKTAVTGYISRKGETDSDSGVFLDQFFAQADVQDHDVSFTTRPLHGVWYEFKGRFDRGPGKTKGDDGYFVLKGTLKELATRSDKTVTSHSREVEFKLLAQPDDTDEPPPAVKKPKS